MAILRRVGPDDWEKVRAVRLDALQDSPDFFWATYEEALDRSDAWWMGFVGSGAWFIAEEGGRPVGVAGVVPAPELDERDRQLISMWVAPGWRGRGVGRQLVEGVISWARGKGVRELQLQVTEGNDPAARLYESCGFRWTGAEEVLPRDPRLVEREMRLRLK